MKTQFPNNFDMFIRSLRAETHLGPDGSRLEQNAQVRLKNAYISMLALWSMEIVDRNSFMWKLKEEKDHGQSQQIKSNNFIVSLWVKNYDAIYSFYNQYQLQNLPYCDE